MIDTHSARTPEPELHRPFAVARITAQFAAFDVVATPEERSLVALRLGIVAINLLECSFRVRRGDDAARGQITAEGVLRASVVQDCVVTLDPFAVKIREAFRVHFVSEGTEVDDVDPESDDEIPYAGDSIDLGEAAVEQLALALDPYPRKPGAELPAEAGPGKTSPFAALARRLREG